MTSVIGWPYVEMRPRGVGMPPNRILIDPYDEPLPLDQRENVTHPGYHTGRIPANKGRRYPIEILTPREVAAVLDAFPTKRQYAGVRNRAIVAVMYRSGLRIGEVTHLRGKDISYEHGMIRVLFGKGQTTRTVGIDDGGLEFIAAWEEQRAEYAFPDYAPLFCSITSGRKVDISGFSTQLKTAAKRSEVLKRVHPHGFRHTFAFELAMEGVPLMIIQRQLGHAWATSTARYVDHIAPIDVINCIRGRSWILQPSVRPGYVNPRAGRRLPVAPPTLALAKPATSTLALVSNTAPDIT